MAILVYIALASFSVAYYLLATVAAYDMPDGVQSLYTLPFYVASFFFLVTAAAQVVLTRNLRTARGFMFVVAIALVCAGYWADGLASYRISAVVSEGQDINTGYLRQSGKWRYAGKYARFPEFALKLTELSTEFSPDGKKINELKGSFELVSDKQKKALFDISDNRSVSSEGMSISISKFGYTPRFELYDDKGNYIDSAFVSLRLFPHGKEDFFRLLSPLTYYLSYFPEGISQNDKSEPVFALRVSRNKDIVYSGNLFPDEKAKVDNALISFPEVRKWTEVTFSGNPGTPLLYIGMTLLAFAALMPFIRKKRKAKVSPADNN